MLIPGKEWIHLLRIFKTRMGNIKQWAISSSFAASYRYRWSITDLFPPLKSFSSLCSRQSRPLGKLWDGINLFAILVLGLLDYINTLSLTCFYLLTFFPRVSYSPSSPPPPTTFFFFFLYHNGCFLASEYAPWMQRIIHHSASLCLPFWIYVPWVCGSIPSSC